MKKLILILPLFFMFLSSCSENGRYVPVVVNGYGGIPYEGDFGNMTESGGIPKIYYMDTQTGKCYPVEIVNKKGDTVSFVY
jgi:hypothetical protein